MTALGRERHLPHAIRGERKPGEHRARVGPVRYPALAALTFRAASSARASRPYCEGDGLRPRSRIN